MSCLSEFALDDFTLHRREGVLMTADTHVAGCASCQQRIAMRNDEHRQFAFIAPGLWRGVVDRRVARRRWKWRLPLVMAPLALAGGLAAVLLTSQTTITLTDRPYVGTKGSFSLTVAARRGDTVFAVDGRRPVRAGDALRFIPQAPEGFRYVALGSKDGRGAFSLFYPAQPEGLSPPMPPAGEALPGSIILDDSAGPERIFVALSDRPLSGSQVQAAAAHSTTGAAPVLVGVRAEFHWITVEKERHPGTPPPSP